jgi:hypothetical protein
MTAGVQTSVLVAPNAYIAGQLANDAPFDAMTLRNEDSVSMPFGSVVAFKTSSPATPQDCILPATSGALLAGIIIHKHSYARTFTLPDGTVEGELDNVGLVVGTSLSVMSSGTIAVICEDGCTPGERLFVRYASGTLGACRATDAGGSTCINANNQGRWLTKTSAGAIGVLQIDFRNA